MVLLRAVGAYESSKDKLTFCCRSGLRLKALTEIHKLCQQLNKICKLIITSTLIK